MAAEYVLKEGNDDVILCERGIRTFETAYRFTLDLMAIPVLKELLAPAGGGRPEPRGRASATSCCRCRSPRPRRAPTASSWRSHPRARGGDLRRPAGRPRRRVRRLHAQARAGRRARGQGARGRRLVGGPTRVTPAGADSRPRRRADRRLGRARRPRRLEGAEVVGFDRDAGPRRGARSSAGRSTASPARWRTRSRTPTRASLCAPVGALPGLAVEALAAARHDCVVTDVGSTKRLIVAAADDERFIGGHPVAGAETRGRRARARGPVRGRRVVPDPRRALVGPPLRAPAPAGGRASARARSRSTPRRTTGCSPPSATCRTCSRTCSSRRRRARLSEEGEALPRVGPSFRDATRVAGANSSVWSGIYVTNAEAIADEIDETAGRLEHVAELLRAGRRDAVEAWNERRRRRPPAPARGRPGGRHGPRAQGLGAESAGHRRPGRGGTRPGGREHRRHGARARARHALRAR